MMWHALRKIRGVSHRIQRRNFSGTTSLVEWIVHEDSIGVITLNSPESYNALTTEVAEAFRNTVTAINRDYFDPSKPSNINSVIVTGSGPAFSAGGNYEWLQALGDNPVHINADKMMQFYNSFLCIRSNVPVPTLAALNGPAIGAGAGLALACDVRTAVPSKKRLLGLNFATLGIHAGMGSSYFLPKIVSNAGLVNEILLWGKALSSEECEKLGLVNRISVDPFETAIEMARDLNTKHPLAVRSMVQTLRQDHGLQAALQCESMAQALCYARNDWGLGVKAVAEKRDAEFDSYYSH